MPMAVPRFSRGNTSRMTVNTIGMTAPVQAACMTRPSKSTQKLGARAAARLPAVNTDSEAMNSWRVVKRPTR